MSSLFRKVLLALACLSGVVGVQAGDGPTRLAAGEWPVSRAEYVGADQCKSCHQVIKAHYAHTKHALAFERNPGDDLEARNCEACHGPGSAHVENPVAVNAIVDFGQDSDLPKDAVNGQCLQCHDEGERTHWANSIHDANDLMCSDCHNPMARFSRKGLQRFDSVNETCMSCHKTQKVEFAKRSHMPLLEGKLACVDCHNPHGSATDPLLKADSVNQVCYTCHQEKRGPFVFEHAPVRENCANCHKPHGSNHESLLKTARPFLCQSCHAHSRHISDLLPVEAGPGGEFSDARIAGRSCQNCHAQIHGSNHPAGVRMHR
ncbi:MAG: DmsE family decaheme c-type cytochrome [Rhodocyclaceae bacterium]|nr:DmsE family decaheme c-type cytochrome [Rhodocyclaceae bacterium]